MMDSSANSVPTKTKVTPLKEVLHVILLQRPNGSFKLDRILAQYLGTSLYDIVGGTSFIISSVQQVFKLCFYFNSRRES